MRIFNHSYKEEIKAGLFWRDNMEIESVFFASMVFMTILFAYIIFQDIRLRNFEKKLEDMKKILREGK